MSCWHVAGAQRWCNQMLSYQGTGIKIDGLAYSHTHVLLVERKTRITMYYIYEFVSKVAKFK